MKPLHYILSCSILAAVAILSCSKETETLFGNQEKKIESYVQTLLKSHEGAFVCYQDGVTRVTVKRSAAETEDSLNTDGLAALWYAGYTFTGSVSVSNLFTTNYTEVTNTWAVSDSSIFKIAMVRPSEGELVDGLRRGLPGVKAGDECYILFSGKYGFGDRILGTIPANAALAYHIWVQSISNE